MALVLIQTDAAVGADLAHQLPVRVYIWQGAISELLVAVPLVVFEGDHSHGKGPFFQQLLLYSLNSLVTLLSYIGVAARPEFTLPFEVLDRTPEHEEDQE